MTDVFKILPEKERSKIKKEKMPNFSKPMLAYLTHTYFADENWLYERKFDGERCLVVKRGKKVTLKSRNDKNLNIQYPEIVTSFEKMDIPDCMLDGEVVAFKGKNTSFEKLQQRLGLKNPEDVKATGFHVYIYIFDILYVNDYNVMNLPLILRKKLIETLVRFKGYVRYSDHRRKNGLVYYKSACKKNWEGLVVKRADSPYQHRRSRDWLKFKCVSDQELVIGGYTDTQHSRIGFGSLLLGYYKADASGHAGLHYAGHVGTGFSDQTLRELIVKLKKIEIDKNPFVNGSKIDLRKTHFVKPKLVAEVGFTEWTRENRLRHPRFQGLRYDKAAKDVVQESVGEWIKKKELDILQARKKRSKNKKS